MVKWFFVIAISRAMMKNHFFVAEPSGAVTKKLLKAKEP